MKNIKNNEYAVYCDESCHLENDHQPKMFLGAIWCPDAEVRNASIDIKKIKIKHNARGELKWTKVSNSRKSFYEEIIEYFVNNKNLHFRCLIVNDKSKLNHNQFNDGSHDMFYYKMYYSMLKAILSPVNKYRIFIDIKDTRSKFKIKTLQDVLCNNVYDFTQQMITNLQHIRSHESEMLQLTDFLLGLVSYKNRNLHSSETKTELVKNLEKKIVRDTSLSTPLSEEKFNIFVFYPLEVK